MNSAFCGIPRFIRGMSILTAALSLANIKHLVVAGIKVGIDVIVGLVFHNEIASS